MVRRYTPVPVPLPTADSEGFCVPRVGVVAARALECAALAADGLSRAAGCGE